MNTEHDIEEWLLLSRVPGMGPRTCLALLQHFGSPQQIFTAEPGKLVALGLRDKLIEGITRPPGLDLIAADLRWLEQEDHHLLTLHHPAYPSLLRELPDPPLLLYVAGNPRLLSQPQIALVGSRNPTPAGRETACDFAASLGHYGYLVTSGLALGIDGASHRGALDSGAPTVAVTGTGLDRVYPASHRDLARRIVEHGAMVSEFPIGTPPCKENFPRRNRLISGLSLGTLVVEAAVCSGSLITARMALEQGREVFAIPGSIHSPQSRGCHALIRDGAKLVENIADILEELQGPPAPTQTPTDDERPETGQPQCDPLQQKVLDHVDYTPTSVDMLVERTGLTAEQLSSILLWLELQNRIVSLSGGTFTRLK